MYHRMFILWYQENCLNGESREGHRCREEWDSIRIENIIRDDKKSKKNWTANYHMKLETGGGGENLPVLACRRGVMLADKGGTKGWVDIHAHILPGVDDGASDWEATNEMLRRAYEQGITHIIATPHYVSGQVTHSLREMVKKLRETAFSISENMMVDLGQEVQYFEELPSFLEQGKPAAGMCWWSSCRETGICGCSGLSAVWFSHPTCQSSPMRSGMTALRRRAGQWSWSGAAHICR